MCICSDLGMSIPATEHSVMTCWPSERAAILNMIEQFGTGAFATVMDSYDYNKALMEVLPSVKEVGWTPPPVLIAQACGSEKDLLLSVQVCHDVLGMRLPTVELFYMPANPCLLTPESSS